MDEHTKGIAAAEPELTIDMGTDLAVAARQFPNNGAVGAIVYSI